MSISPFDSAIYRDQYLDLDMARVFTDTAEVRAILLVWGAVAKAQGQAGVIPEISAAFLHRAMMEVQIDPAALSPDVAQIGHPVLPLLGAVQKALEAPEHARYLHVGLTASDVEATATMLRLRQSLALLRERLDDIMSRALKALVEMQGAPHPQSRIDALLSLDANRRILADHLATGLPLAFIPPHGDETGAASLQAEFARALKLRDAGSEIDDVWATFLSVATLCAALVRDCHAFALSCGDVSASAATSENAARGNDGQAQSGVETLTILAAICTAKTAFLSDHGQTCPSVCERLRAIRMALPTLLMSAGQSTLFIRALSHDLHAIFGAASVEDGNAPDTIAPAETIDTLINRLRAGPSKT